MAARRAIESVDVFIPVAVLVLMGALGAGLLFRQNLPVAASAGFFWLVVVLAVVAWYNFMAARVGWPHLEIGDRERRIWRREWVPPLVLVLGALIGLRLWD
jgi:hypothetical protein